MTFRFPQTETPFHYSGVIPIWCFNIVGGEILTFPDTSTTERGYPYGVSTYE